MTATPNPNSESNSNGIQLLESVGESDCSFCTSKLKEGEGVMLHKCLHTFCRPCLTVAVEQSTDPQIQCPMHFESQCGGVLLDPEIRALLNHEDYDKYLERSLTLATKGEKLYKCKTKDCKGVYLLEKTVKSFICDECRQRNCTKCWGIHVDGDHCPRLTDSRKRKILDVEQETLKKQKLQHEAEQLANEELKKDWDDRWTKMEKQVQENGSESELKVAELFDAGLIVSTHVFDCSICLTEAPIGEGIVLKDCFHTFCRECLQSVVTHCEEPEVKCPFQGTHTTCNSLIQECEIKALSTPEIFEKHLSRSIAKAEVNNSNAFHCKSVNCPGWVEIEEGAVNFLCSVCKKTNCIECKTIHEAVTCKEYQHKIKYDYADDESKRAMEKLISGGKAMRCPTCKVIIVKSGGCDGIQCRICRTMLCWATKGPRWGPKGPGDTSGGCRCGVNGKKCHPKCHFCH